MTSRRTVVVLGPTASGKSDVAMAVAEAMAVAGAMPSGSVHVTAADAMQVYRRMDIGTAKPTAEDRVRVPHHGLDLVEPSERYTVARYIADVSVQRDAITAAGAREIIVGGTGLYVTALVDGLTMPGEWPEIRADLETNADTADMWERLRTLDAQAAARIEPGNRRRIVRALEVCLGSGRPFSSFGDGVAAFPPTDIAQVGLRWTRDALRERIARRVHRMVADGLVDEVEGLLAEPTGLSPTARQALGYKEIIDHLEGRCSLDESVAAVILRTQQFAVRQERWYRRDPRIEWIDIRRDPIAEVTPRVTQLLA